MYVPLAMLGGAVLFWLSKGVGFLEAIDLSLGILLTSNQFIWLLICPFAWIYYFYNRRKQSSPKQSVQQQTATSVPITTTLEPDTKFYEQALAELDSDERDSGIWAKAYAEADNEEASRKLYVKLRAADLMRERVEESTREVIREITPEEARKNAEDGRKRETRKNIFAM